MIQGSQAGTALRASLLSLANPVGQTEKAMEALGVKVTDANGNMKPLPELIGHINEKLDGMTSAQKTATVAQLVGTEAASGFVAMLEIGEEKLSDYASELKNAGGTAERVAKTQMDTLKGSFIEFQSAVEGLGIKIGDDLLPIFTDIVREGTGIVRVLGEMDATGVKTGLAFAGTASALALVATTAIKLGTALRGLMVAMGPAGWLITGASVVVGVLAGVSVAQKELSEVSLENAEAMEQQRVALSNNIAEYDNLSAKSRLTNDELARFVDINSEISKTADPTIIAKLRDEQERLREKSGLSNDELNRMVELNGKILEVVPESNTTLTEQGNVLLNNTANAKAFNAEQAELIRLELEAQAAKAESNMSQYLTDEKRLITEIKDLKKEMQGIDTTERDLRGDIGELEARIAEAKRKNDDAEVGRLNILLGVENGKLRKLQEQKAESAELILNKTKELDKIQAQIGKLDEVKRKMIDLELKQVGINGKRGQEIKQIDSAISKLETQKQKLQNTTPAAERNTEEYRRSVSAIDSQISGLDTARSRINDIIGRAGVMNSELGRDINKTVTITEQRYGRVVRRQGGFIPEYHTGGIVGRGQMPKLHTGGLASQFASMPNHNEIDTRLLRNEMVLTEAQQANLMRMIDAGFTNQAAGNTGDLSALVNALSGVTDRPIQLAVNIDGYQVAEAAYPFIDLKLAQGMRDEARTNGVKLP